ncbi:hypothetical protein ABPG75_000613 [Micractinium tetrahymenae]
MRLSAAAALLCLVATAATAPLALAGSWSPLGGPISTDPGAELYNLLASPSDGAPWAVFTQRLNGSTACAIAGDVTVLQWKARGGWKAVGPRCSFSPVPDSLALSVRANGNPVLAMNIEKVEMGFLPYPYLSYWDGSKWRTVGEDGWYDMSSIMVQRMFIRGRGGGWPAETALIFARHAYDGSWLLLTFDFNDSGYTDSEGTLWYGPDFQGG